MIKIKTMADLKAVHRANGGYWFQRDTMKFFNSKIHGGIRRGKFFISSEQTGDEKRKFTIRTFDRDGRISDVGAFGQYSSLQSAKNVLKGLPCDA